MDHMISQHEPDDIKNVVWNSILYCVCSRSFLLMETNGLLSQDTSSGQV